MPRDIDYIIKRLRSDLPEVQITQLQVSHPGADDDGLWFITKAGDTQEVQIESPDGCCPFTIQSNVSSEVQRGQTVDEVVSIIRNVYT